MKPKLSPEEIKVLRRETHGKGNLAASGFIVITPAGRDWIAKDDERIKRERIAGGNKGKKYGVQGGRPITKGGKK